jgi:hypothetical protein
MKYSPRIRKVSQALLVLVCLSLGLAGAAWGQVSSGALTGVVTDPSGAVIPGAKVTLTDVGKSTEFPATTDAEGRYVIRALPPSTYRLKVEAAGFSTYVQDNIVLAVNQSSSITVQLKVGSTTEVIEVTSGAALLSTQDASTGQEIQRSFINELPLLGRGVYDLTNLAPGVTQVSGGYIGGSLANNFISNGSRNAQADIIADGATTSNFEQNTGIQTSMYSPSVDMVQEFKLQQANFSAEQGFSGSTIINLVTRSGTNDFHGTAWWFVRRNGLTANNWYANAGGIPLAPRKYNLFGANGGGPIIKDKLFFFFNYEGLRDTSASTYTAGVPSPAMKKGDFGEICAEGFDASGKCKGDGQLWDPYSGVYSADEGGPIRSLYIPYNNMATYQSPGTNLPAGYSLPAGPGNIIDPVSLKMINYYPDPNVNVGQANYNRFNNWVGAGNHNSTNNMYDTKIDWNINTSNVLSAKYSISPGVGTTGEIWPGTSNAYCSAVNGPSTNKNQVFSMNYNHTFSPSTILTTTLGWARNAYNRADTIATVPGYDPVADLGLPEYTLRSGFLATPGIYVSNYDTIQPGLTDIGSQPWGIMRQATETYHLLSTLSQIRGKHELRIGGEGRMHRLNYAQPGEPNGVYDFESVGMSEHPWWGGGDAMASFLTGSGGSGGWGGYEVPVFGATQSYQWAAFVQDNWKITPKLTLNLGVRYDLNTPRTERFDRGSYWDPEATSPLAGQIEGFPNLKGAVAFIDSNNRHYFSYDKNNLAPRFGFAYQATPKTVIRGGYGLFYSIVTTGASGVGSGFQGFSQGTNWESTYQYNGVTPWGFMANPFPNGGPLLPIGSSQGASSFLGDSFSGPMLTQVQLTPYEQTWTLGFQHELPGNIIIDANYVGKKGTKLYFGGSGDFNTLGSEIESYTADQIADLNTYVDNPFYGHLPPGAPMDTPTVTKSQLMQPYPQYNGVSTLTLPIGNSMYHAFQLRVEKRFSKGLQFLVAYTNQKSIDDSSVGHGGLTWLGGSTSLQDPNKRYLERSLSQYDIPQVLNMSYVYHFPFGRGKAIGSNWNPWVDAFLGGWKTNGILRFSRGQPLAIYLASSQSLPTYGGQRANLTGTLTQNTGENWKEQYFANPEVVVQPASYTIGNAPRTIGSVRTPGIKNADLSVLKDVYVSKLREGTRFEFRAEFFNAFNHPIFGGPNTSLGGGQFGLVNSQANRPREVQLALKFYW